MKKLLLSILSASSILLLTSCQENKVLNSREVLNSTILPSASYLTAKEEFPNSPVLNYSSEITTEERPLVEARFTYLAPLYSSFDYSDKDLDNELVQLIQDDVEFQEAVSHDPTHPAVLANVSNYTFFAKDYLNRDVLYAFYFNDLTTRENPKVKDWEDYTFGRDFTLQGALAIFLKNGETFSRQSIISFDILSKPAKDDLEASVTTTLKKGVNEHTVTLNSRGRTHIKSGDSEICSIYLDYDEVWLSYTNKDSDDEIRFTLRKNEEKFESYLLKGKEKRLQNRKGVFTTKKSEGLFVFVWE